MTVASGSGVKIDDKAPAPRSPGRAVRPGPAPGSPGCGRPCGKVSMSPALTSWPGLRQMRVPFTRRWPSATTSAARSRDLKNRACHSHLSSRSFRAGQLDLVLPEGPANQTLPFSASSTAKGLSGSIGFSARGGRASKDFWPGRRGRRACLPGLAARLAAGRPCDRACRRGGRSPSGRGRRSGRGRLLRAVCGRRLRGTVAPAGAVAARATVGRGLRLPARSGAGGPRSGRGRGFGAQVKV